MAQTLEELRLSDRFWSKVEANDDGCWLWVGAISGGDESHGGGYGRLTRNGRGQLAHRVAYELVIGPIPSGLQIDHLCRVRCCVRPDHLEAVTPRENTLRGSSPNAVASRDGTCTQGHVRTAATTYLTPSSGKLRCVLCEPARNATQQFNDPQCRRADDPAHRCVDKFGAWFESAVRPARPGTMCFDEVVARLKDEARQERADLRRVVAS